MVDICKKWTYEKFIRKNLTFDLSSKILNKIDYNKQCVICGFDLGVAKEYGADSNKMSYYDFAIKKEHHFLRNIFSTEELLLSKNMKDIESYYKTLKKYKRTITYLVTEVDTIDDSIMEDFFKKGGFDFFLLYHNINLKIPRQKKNTNLNNQKSYLSFINRFLIFQADIKKVRHLC